MVVVVVVTGGAGHAPGLGLLTGPGSPRRQHAGQCQSSSSADDPPRDGPDCPGVSGARVSITCSHDQTGQDPPGLHKLYQARPDNDNGALPTAPIRPCKTAAGITSHPCVSNRPVLTGSRVLQTLTQTGKAAREIGTRISARLSSRTCPPAPSLGTAAIERAS